MADSVTGFYDGLASEYHLLFADWDAAVRRQGDILDRLIVSELGRKPGRQSGSLENQPSVSLLDCSCGIGTQAIGLAERGYRVHATDIAPAAVARAAREAARLNVALTTGVADIRSLDTAPGTYDVVISCDNAVPHLLTDEDLLLAASGMHARLREGGLLVISLRDYDRLLAERPRAGLPRIFERPDGRQIAFQVWDWSTDTDTAVQTYIVHQFIVREHADGNWHTHHKATVYRALQRHELAGTLQQAGFHSVRWHEPADSGYYQPIVTARR
jgi:glycine/sarcosine N-methyltransferase